MRDFKLALCHVAYGIVTASLMIVSAKALEIIMLNGNPSPDIQEWIKSMVDVGIICAIIILVCRGALAFISLR